MKLRDSSATTKAAHNRKRQADPTAAERQVVVFRSDLGWIVIEAGIAPSTLNSPPSTLHRLSFGHVSPRQALAALGESTAVEPSDTWTVKLVRRLRAYAQGAVDDFRDVPLDLPAKGAFERRVIDLCRAIPFGKTVTYGALAAQAGSPRAARAVGNVMRTNCCPLIVPCHRVVPAGPGLGNYSAQGGVRMKLRLLEMEGRLRVEC